MIRMKSGVYGGKNLIRREDGPFSLSAQEEARLVARGVAEYVGEPVQPASASAAAPIKPMEDMTLVELRAMGKEYGLTFKVGMTKTAMVEAIKAEITQEQADEEPEDIEDDAEDIEIEDEEDKEEQENIES